MAGFLGSRGPPTFDAADVYSAMETYTPDMLVKSPLLGQQLAAKFSISRTSEPDHPVVLQRKHGFTCIGDSIQQAVYRAIYLQKNCALLKDAIDISQGTKANISYLTEEEAAGCAKMNQMTQDKAFRLWLREVETNPLYRNDEGVPKDLPVGGIVGST